MSDLIEPNERDVQRLQAAIDDIVSIDPQRFSQISAPGVTIRIDESEKVLGQIADSFRRVRDIAIDSLPAYVVKILAQAIRATQDALEQVDSLDASNSSSQDFRQQVMGVLNNAHQQVYNGLVPILAHADVSSANLADLQRSAEQVVQDVKKISDNMQKTEEEARVALERIQGAAAEAGVSQHETIFSTSADEHAKLKTRWIIVSVIIAVITVATAVYTMMVRPEHSDTLSYVGYLSGRLFLFGILSYALVWSGRMYRAQAHNEIVNRHRQNALETFDTFTAASSDIGTKNAILMQATMCIFSHRPSGFGQDEGDLPPQSHLVELTRNVIANDSSAK